MEPIVCEASVYYKKKVKRVQARFVKSGLRTEAQLIIHCGDNEEKNRELIMDLLSADRPYAIFASVEKLIKPCYDVCKKLNIKIPEELTLRGCSNSQMAEYLNPPFSTIVQPAYEIGKEATKLLFNLIDKKINSFHESLILPSKTFIRNSTL